MPLAIFKKIRLFSWTISAFFKKYGKIIIVSLALGTIIFLFLNRMFVYLPKIKRQRRIGIIGQYSSNNLPDEVLTLLGKGLTVSAQDGSVAPGLSSGWKVSSNGLLYTFVLKNNIFWQDGQEIKAKDINYHFKDVSQEIVDDKTLKFKLKEPFSPFLSVLSRPVFKTGFLGSGPYAITKIKKKNGNISFLKLRGPDVVIFHFYPTVEEAVLAFKLGKIDEINDGLSVPFDQQWKKNIETKVVVKKNYYLGLFLNNKDALLGSKELRQALAYAISYDNSKRTRTYSPLNPDSWAYNSQVKVYNFDPEKAKSLLKKFNKDGEKKEIKLKISTQESFLNLAEEIQQSWEKVLGIKTEVEVINFLPQNYQVFLGIQKIPIDPDQYILWHSTRQENITHFKDPKIDKLLEDARKIQDKDERRLKYLDFQKFLLEECPVIFLYHPKIFQIKRRYLVF